MSRYRIETFTPGGQPINVPIPDEFVDMIKVEARKEAAEEIRTAVSDFAGYRPKWKSGMLEAADKIEPKG